MNVIIKPIPFQDTWPIRQRVMWPDKELEYVKLPHDSEGVHFGLFFKSDLVSVISLFASEENMQFRKFATEKDFQGLGYGTRLLEFVFKYAKSLPVRRIWCNARKDRTGFYQKFGMDLTSSTFKKGGIDYVIMEKKL